MLYIFDIGKYKYMKITFKDLENFVVSAKSKTLSEASEKLNMAQPSLSLGIRKLEKELGYPLFYRGRNGLKLSPQGKNLLPEAQAALENLQRIKGKKSIQRFRIGCHPSVGIFILGEFLRQIHIEKSEFDFEIINASSKQVNQMVAQGDIDLGIVMNPMPLQGLIVKSIGEDTVHVWESSHRYQDKLICNPQMIQTTSIMSRWKNPPQNSIEVQSIELISHLTASGAGYGIIPSQVVKAQGHTLKRVSNTPSFRDHLTLVCFPEMIRSPEGKLIFDTLKKSYKN